MGETGIEAQMVRDGWQRTVNVVWSPAMMLGHTGWVEIHADGTITKHEEPLAMFAPAVGVPVLFVPAEGESAR